MGCLREDTQAAHTAAQAGWGRASRTAAVACLLLWAAVVRVEWHRITVVAALLGRTGSWGRRQGGTLGWDLRLLTAVASRLRTGAVLRQAIGLVDAVHPAVVAAGWAATSSAVAEVAVAVVVEGGAVGGVEDAAGATLTTAAGNRTTVTAAAKSAAIVATVALATSARRLGTALDPDRAAAETGTAPVTRLERQAQAAVGMVREMPAEIMTATGVDATEVTGTVITTETAAAVPRIATVAVGIESAVATAATVTTIGETTRAAVTETETAQEALHAATTATPGSAETATRVPVAATGTDGDTSDLRRCWDGQRDDTEAPRERMQTTL